jgi:hypothetical protein
MAGNLINLVFPLGGLNRAVAARQQPPYTTPDCLNVRPDCTLEGRERGGSRPGLGKAYRQRCGVAGNYPLRLLTSVTSTKDDGFRYTFDGLEGEDLGDMWTAAPWIGDPPDYQIPPVLPDDLNDIEWIAECGAVRDALPGLDTTQAYSIEIYIVPFMYDEDNGLEHFGEYRLYARLNDAEPDLRLDGVEANLILTGTDGTYGGSLKVYANGALAAEYDFDVTASPTGGPDEGWFTLLVNGNLVSCYWQGNTLLTPTDISADLDAGAGNRVGFGIECTVEGGVCLVDLFRAQYYQSAIAVGYRSQLIASAGGKLYEETKHGEIAEITGLATDVASGHTLQAAERAQKLFIADYDEPRVYGTAVITSGGLELDGTGPDGNAIDDWTAYNIDKDGDVVVLYNAQGDTVDGTYTITALGATVTLGEVAGDGTAHYRITRSPKIYDPVARTLTVWRTESYTEAEGGGHKGEVPTGCRLITLYRDALVLAGDPYDPQCWYMSRLGNPYDFDFGPEDPINDPTKAIAGNNSESGLVGEAITCLISHNDDHLIFGGTNSLWVMSGHAAYSGSIWNLSHIAGVAGDKSWCHDPNGATYFLSLDGLYKVPAGSELAPVSISREKLPRELLNIDRNLYEVSMEYDVRERGIHIYLTPLAPDGQTRHWWMDLKYESFWPVKLHADHEPFVTYCYNHAPTAESKCLLGGRDGYIRGYRSTCQNDDGYTPIDSYVTYGPLRIGGSDYYEGIIKELQGTLARNSQMVQWDVYTATTHEGTLRGTPKATGTWMTGRNYTARPNSRGGSLALKISSLKGRWAIENITATIRGAGRQRK